MPTGFFKRVAQNSGTSVYTGPNVPAAYSLAQQFLISSESSQQSTSGQPNTTPNPTGSGQYSVDSFPSYGSSGGLSSPVSVGVRVSAYWSGLQSSVT